MADRLSKEHRSWNMSRVRCENTKPEKMLRSMLHRTGYRFRVNVAGIPGKPDIVLKKYRTVIFVDGCFWHRHEGCKKASMPKTRRSFWENKFQENIERDLRQTKQLQEHGWNVIRIWECELEKSPDLSLEAVVKKIQEVI
ncbi:very short patch repair endonuclease [Kordiimonas marina]|uniref:very short patch repair endonuclease n=1 Tax=Kordiimonas marina TaxID=2872312 RepID=UPI001FF4FCB0|nr:very short patch repair endonuclease [Kordiimonas marina]MCJ9430729.1 very short patch repair endonuclease [Kordiimonas marina]